MEGTYTLTGSCAGCVVLQPTPLSLSPSLCSCMQINTSPLCVCLCSLSPFSSFTDIQGKGFWANRRRLPGNSDLSFASSVSTWLRLSWRVQPSPPSFPFLLFPFVVFRKEREE